MSDSEGQSDAIRADPRLQDTAGTADAYDATIATRYLDTYGADDAVRAALRWHDTVAAFDALRAEPRLQDTAGYAEGAVRVRADLNDTYGWADDLGVQARLTDTYAGADAARITSRLQDTAGQQDGLGASTTGLFDTYGALDAVTATINDLRPADDAWVEQANGGTNHGADADLEVRSANLLGGGERRALIEFDLSGVVGFTATAGAELVIYALEEALLNAGITIEFRTDATDIFDESTVTWNNQPSPALQFSKTVTLSGATPTEYRVALTQADVNDLVGNFVLLRITNGNTADTPRIAVQSKEDATVSQRPRLEGIQLAAI